jgi:hypothetical protein
VLTLPLPVAVRAMLITLLSQSFATTHLSIWYIGTDWPDLTCGTPGVLACVLKLQLHSEIIEPHQILLE